MRYLDKKGKKNLQRVKKILELLVVYFSLCAIYHFKYQENVLQNK